MMVRIADSEYNLGAIDDAHPVHMLSSYIAIVGLNLWQVNLSLIEIRTTILNVD